MEIAKLEELAFNEESHRYTVNGFVLPSVTQIMEPLSMCEYNGVNDDTLSQAASRGTKVHEAMELYMLYGIKDIQSDYSGYLDSFLAWCNAKRPQPLATEYRTYHKILGYAGTADLICLYNDKVTLVDYKTTSRVMEMLTRVQTEAYAKALESHGINIEQKIVLQVKKDGKYKEEWHGVHDNEAWRIFCDLLEVNNYIKKYKKA